MSDTTFVDKSLPVISAEWLNEVNDHLYHDAPVVGTAVHDASVISYNPAGTGAVATTVQAKLRGIISAEDFRVAGDDSATIQAALDYAKMIADDYDEGTSVVIDLGGKAYALESGVVFSNGGEGITLQNGRLIATGSGWASTDYVVTMSSWAARSRLLNVMVDCGKIASGVDVRCGRGRIEDCEVHHFRGIGVNLSSTVAGDSRLYNTTVYEWSNGDPEFVDNANYIAVGVKVNRADQEIRDCIVRWCGTCFYFGASATTTTVIGCHPYNGGAGQTAANTPWTANTAYVGGAVVTPTVPNGKYYSCSKSGTSGASEPTWNTTAKSITTDGTAEWRCLTTSKFVRYHPKLIVAERGAGVMFNGCYLDNGEIDLYGDQIGVAFNGCRVLYSYEVAHLDYFIGLFATNNTAPTGQSIGGPWKFHAQGWEYASLDLFDGTLPFIQKFNYLDNWAGDDTNFVEATGYKEMLENWHVSKCQADADPVLTLHTPGSSGYGAKLALSDAGTATPPYLATFGDYLFLSKPLTAQGTAVTTSKTYAQGEDVGRLIGVNNGSTPITLTFPATEVIGARREFQLNGTAPVTFSVASEAELRLPYGVVTSAVIPNRRYSRAVVLCVGGTAGAAVYSLHLDGYEIPRQIGSFSVNTTLVAGQYEQGFINITNGTTPVTISLPDSNRVGWRTTLHQRGTGTVTLACTGGAGFASYITTPTLLGQYATVEIICTANATGTNAEYAVTGQAS